MLTIVDVFRPVERSRAAFYNICTVLGGSLLIAVCARISFFIPGSLVPVTGQTFAVLLVGAALGAKLGVSAVLLYITYGVCGLPVFSMGMCGPGVLFGPTGGYLAGFIASAYIVGSLSKEGFDRNPLTAAVAMLLGSCGIYAFGLSWLGAQTGFDNLLSKGFYPFIVGDILKIALASALLPACWKILKAFKSL